MNSFCLPFRNFVADCRRSGSKFLSLIILAVSLPLSTVVFAADASAEMPVSALDPIFQGEFKQGGLVIGRTLPGTNVVFEGRQVQVSPQGVFVIGFGRNAKPTTSLELTSAKGETVRREYSVEQREYRIQKIDGLPPSKVVPPPETIARIRRESAAASRARRRNDERTDYANGFIWPAIGPISGVYGSQRVLNGKPKRPHYGVDIARPTGTEVVAPAAGIVTLAHPGMYFSGKTLIIDHGHGLSSSFLHLSAITVEEGQRVEQGDPIAKIGSTGRSTGPHLDWRMNLFKARVDPQLLVGPMPPLEPAKPNAEPQAASDAASEFAGGAVPVANRVNIEQGAEIAPSKQPASVVMSEKTAEEKAFSEKYQPRFVVPPKQQIEPIEESE